MLAAEILMECGWVGLRKVHMVEEHVHLSGGGEVGAADQRGRRGTGRCGIVCTGNLGRCAKRNHPGTVCDGGDTRNKAIAAAFKLAIAERLRARKPK